MRLQWAQSTAGTAVADITTPARTRVLLPTLMPADQVCNRQTRTARMCKAAALPMPPPPTAHVHSLPRLHAGIGHSFLNTSTYTGGKLSLPR